MTAAPADTIHATTVAIGAVAVMIVGPSGSGKSDLALRLIDRGATLVSDDRTRLVRVGDTLHAHPPATIAGLIEVRGVGVCPVAYRADVPVALLVRLDAAPDRLPEPGGSAIAGVVVPELAVDPLPASAPIKVERALARLLAGSGGA